jgi:serine protease Do
MDHERGEEPNDAGGRLDAGAMSDPRARRDARRAGRRIARLAAVLALLGAGAAAPARADDPFLRRTPTVRAVERVGPAVVNITTARTVRASPFGRVGDPLFDNFFHRFFEPRLGQRSVQSLGSGVLIDADRHVLTNAHVVERAESIRVKLADGREFDATAVGVDANNDLAVLRVESDERLPWIEPGRSDDLLVGEPVIAIGNPFGLSNTVTTGVISAVDRSIRTDDRVFHGFLQTDASINPGNSGGPLLNAEGSLIGVNTAIYGGNAEGIGFAIPIDVARRIVHELIVHGTVAPVWMGVELQALQPELRRELGIPEALVGVLVSHVSGDGPARRAGLERGDVVTHLEGQPIADPPAFYEVLNQVTRGQKTRLAIWRGGRERTLRPVAAALPDGIVEELALRLMGLRLEANPSGGFVVQSVRTDSGAARIGLQPGDLLVAVNGRPLRDEESLRASVLGLRGRGQALVVVRRGRGRYHVTLPLG